MEGQVIFLKEALKVFSLRDANEKPIPFHLTYRTYNSKMATGGKLKVFENVVYLPSANPSAIPSLHPSAVFAPDKIQRNPNHFDNRTRNIELPTGEINKIRIDFMIAINGQKIIY